MVCGSGLEIRGWRFGVCDLGFVVLWFVVCGKLGGGFAPYTDDFWRYRGLVADKDKNQQDFAQKQTIIRFPNCARDTNSKTQKQTVGARNILFSGKSITIGSDKLLEPVLQTQLVGIIVS